MGLFSSAKSIFSGGGKILSGDPVGGFQQQADAFGVTDMIPGLGDSAAQKRANDANIRLALANRKWMEMMSNTAYQRAMKDMKTAGLNPMLAYMQGGASVPNSTAATVSPESKTGLLDAGLKAYTGLSAARTAQQQANTAQAAVDSSIQLQSAQAAKEIANTQNIQADTALKQREIRGKGIKETIDREGGRIIQKILDNVSTSAKETLGNHNKLKESVKEKHPKAHQELSKPLPKIF